MDKNVISNLFALYYKPMWHCFKYILKINHSYQKPNVQNKFWCSYKTLENIGEMPETDDKHNLWALKFIFSSSHGKLFPVLSQATTRTYTFSF